MDGRTEQWSVVKVSLKICYLTEGEKSLEVYTHFEFLVRKFIKHDKASVPLKSSPINSGLHFKNLLNDYYKSNLKNLSSTELECSTFLEMEQIISEIYGEKRQHINAAYHV